MWGLVADLLLGVLEALWVVVVYGTVATASLLAIAWMVDSAGGDD